nr:HNH endonuclease signature motif containing protein [Microcella frigidaquae]
MAGEIARRSAHELGASGLAQRTGHRTADELVTVTTGSRRADARTAVRVGATLVDPRSTLDPVASAVLDGRVSVTVADALRRGLGEPGGDVSAELLAAESAVLVESVGRLDADRAEREARAARDDLELRLSSDVDGVAEREEARRAQRSLRIGRRADGMGYASWTLDPESFALVSEVYDRLTAPQRRVPSFDDGGGASAETDGFGDERTDVQRTDAQRASDGFVELLRQGVAADPAHLLGDGPIGVRVLVAAEQFDARRGRGFLEGQHDPVSLATVERIACGAGTVALLIDAAADNAGQPLNLGRERRLFSRAQRLALAARDGGCRWPGCERPPSWCEAHHIEHWQRDGGRTDVADGILLCRHHHLLAHNNGWEITRAGPQYLLHPPGVLPGGPTSARPGAPPGEHPPEPLDMPSRSRALSDALAGARAEVRAGTVAGARAS